MKLQFLQAHPSVGALCKQFGLEVKEGSDTRSYPLASKLKTHPVDVEISLDGLRKYRELLAEHAAQGHALLKNVLKDGIELNFESRKGKADAIAKTQLLVLDVDGIEIQKVTPAPYHGAKITAEDVKRCAEAIVSLLPPALREVSYVAVASSSFGLKDGLLNMHLHFFLDSAVNPESLKQWIRALNITIPEVESQLKLTPSCQGVKSIIDPCLAENSRIIYIAPPVFGPHRENPFADNSDRIVLVEKNKHSFNLNPFLAELNVPRVNAAFESKLKEVCRMAGIKFRKPTRKKMMYEGQETWILTNPERTTMSYASHDDNYVRYNLPGCESGAYWVHRKNPNIVFCFKPDETPFLFEQADPEAYAWHRETFGCAEHETKIEGTNEVVKTVQMAFRDFHTDKIYCMYYDRSNDEIVKMAEASRQSVEDWLMENGQPPADYIPTKELVFDPSDHHCLTENRVNLFAPSKYMKTEYEKEYETKYARTGVLWGLCPRIATIAYHMLGSDDQCFEHFMNWLAFVYQRREKTRTAWLLQGTEGTGKGLFFKRVLKPLFGKKHTIMKQLDNLVHDKFNDWMKEVVLMFVDEFNMNDNSNETRRTANWLKNSITEDDITFRGMRVSQLSGVNYLNYIAATNDIDALSISQEDRRWNVAPRQERKLQDLYPEFMLREEEIDAEIEAELDDFAQFLYTFNVNVPQVRRPIWNAAKVSAQLAGMNIQDLFLNAFRRQNIDLFVDILGRKPSIANANEAPLLNAAQTIVKKWVVCCVNGYSVNVATDEIRTLYEYLIGQAMKPAAFARLLNKSGLVTEKRRCDGYKNPISCVPDITWRCTLDEGIIPYAAALGAVDGVEPFTKPEEDAA